MIFKFIAAVFRWTGGFIAWIIGGLGAFFILMGIADFSSESPASSTVYFEFISSSTLYFMGTGLALLIGAAIVHNWLTDI